MSHTNSHLAELRRLLAKTNVSGPGLTSADIRKINSILNILNYETLGTNNKKLYNRALNSTTELIEVKPLGKKGAKTQLERAFNLW